MFLEKTYWCFSRRHDTIITEKKHYSIRLILIDCTQIEGFYTIKWFNSMNHLNVGTVCVSIRFNRIPHHWRVSCLYHQALPHGRFTQGARRSTARALVQCSQWDDFLRQLRWERFAEVFFLRSQKRSRTKKRQLFWESSRFQGGKTMGKLWENYGKTMGKLWENYGKTMENSERKQDLQVKQPAKPSPATAICSAALAVKSPKHV